MYILITMYFAKFVVFCYSFCVFLLAACLERKGSVMPIPSDEYQIWWDDFQDKMKELTQPLHRLRWCVEFAFVEWADEGTAARQSWYEGLLVLAPESAKWREDAEGRWWGQAWTDTSVLALQGRLQPLFDAIVSGMKPVTIALSPVKFTWHPGPGSLLAPRPLVLSEPFVEWEHENGLDPVEMAMYCVSLLLHQHPGSIRRCYAPRTRRMKHNRPECGRLFVAVRSVQSFCSSLCAARNSRRADDGRREFLARRVASGGGEVGDVVK